MFADRRRTRPRRRIRNFSDRRTLHEVGGEPSTVMVTPGVVAPGVVDSNEQLSFFPLMRTMLADCVMYRQPAESTAAKSPRLPPVNMSLSVGGVFVRSTRVTVPSLRFATT